MRPRQIFLYLRVKGIGIHEKEGMGSMISFLEMAQHYPVGSKVSMPEESGEAGMQREVVGYEYYNGTGYLLFRNEEKIDVERLRGLEAALKTKAL